MASSLAELVRPTQTTRSAAQQSVLVSTAKPKTRFDDVLSQHRPAEPKQPKAERPEPSVKADRPKKVDAAKSKKGDEPVDEAQPHDDPSQETAATDEAADEAQANRPAEKPNKAKPSKDAKNADATNEASADEASPQTTPTDDTTAAAPLAELPVDAIAGDGEDADAGEKKPVADDKATDADALIDPNALLAQLNPAQQQQPTDDQSAQVDPAAAADVTTVTAASAKGQAESARAATGPKPAEATLGDGELAVKPHAEKGHHAAGEDLPAEAEETTGAIQLPPELTKHDTKSSADVKLDASVLQAVAAPHEKTSVSHTAMPAVPQAEAAVSPRTVAEENVDRIVTSIHGDIATKGGTMQIRLDPPSLGAINVQISIDDGVMSASLQTNNDEATRLLSHNLAQLKSQLESAGVNVDRIQVKQATPTEQSSNSNSQSDSGDRSQNRDAGQDQSARQEQQRREMLQRMWAKLAGNGDPLDLVA